jgi:hypothetical protein
MTKQQIEIRKNNKHYTNYGQNNRNVEMCWVKKIEEPIVITTKATNQPLKRSEK